VVISTGSESKADRAVAGEVRRGMSLCVKEDG